MFKLRKLWHLIVMAMTTVGLSAQVSPAISDPPSNQQVVAFLTKSIDWYRHCAIERKIATDPVDLVFLEDNRPSAAQILQLSFEFARAGAQFSAMPAAGSQNPIATGPPDLAQFVNFENRIELQTRQASEEIEILQKNLKASGPAERRELQAELDATQS